MRTMEMEMPKQVRHDAHREICRLRGKEGERRGFRNKFGVTEKRYSKYTIDSIPLMQRIPATKNMLHRIIFRLLIRQLMRPCNS